MLIKIIKFLLIYEILTMRSIKRKKEETKAQFTCKLSRNMFESELNDELIKAYRRFFVKNKNSIVKFKNEGEETASILSNEKDILPEELIQKYEEFFPESFEYGEVGNLVVDEFGNLMEVVEVPLKDQNSISVLYEDISSDSNASENEYYSFKQIVSTKKDQLEKINVFDEPNNVKNIDKNNIEKFLLPFTLSERFNKNILEERNSNNFEEHMVSVQEINTDEFNTIILDNLQKTNKDFSLGSSYADQDVITDIEEQFEEFNAMLELTFPTNLTEISLKHSLHENIDEILNIDSVQNPVEHNVNENIDYQEQNPLEILNINNPLPEYTESYEGTLKIPDDRPFTSMPILNISSTVITSSCDHSTIVKHPGDLPSIQQNTKVLVTSETSPRLPEVSLQPKSHNYIEMVYSKLVQNIKNIKIPNTFAKWQISRLDEIKLFINFIRFSKSKYFNIINSFFDFLDDQITFILDKHKLRSSNQLEAYDLKNYDTFMFEMTETINENHLYLWLMQYKNNFEENILHILCFEFVQLFDYFPKFPELITLGCLFNQGGDERLILYLRLIHLIINENMKRLEEVKPVVLFIIKKSFMTPDRKGKDINIKAFEKFTISEFYIVKSVCKKDHSSLCFFLWEFPPKKLKSMKYDGKVKGGYIYDITLKNIEYFRIVLHTFIFQHIMFTEYHDITYERYEKLLDESFKPDKCVFCLFEEYLGLLINDTPKKT